MPERVFTRETPLWIESKGLLLEPQRRRRKRSLRRRSPSSIRSLCNREFYEFEKELHERLMEAQREIVGGVMAASDVDADAIAAT